MAAKKALLRYLEAVEETQDESQESDEVGSAAVASLQKWKLSKGIRAVAGSGILAHSTKKRLAAAGYVKIRNYYESLHSSDETAVYRAVCTVV